MLEMTREEIFTSSDEQDAQKREEEEGEFLTPSAEMVNVDTKSEKTTTSSDMSVRGIRSRGNSTMSTSSGSCLEELRFMIQSLSTGVQNSSNLGEVIRSEHAATANAITNLGTDVKRVITKVDIIEEEVERRRRYLRRRTQKVEEAIQEHEQKIQQMEEDIAKTNAGENNERTTRIRKPMESDLGEKHKGHWSPSSITFDGWVDCDRKMETMMDSADAERF